MKKFIPLVVVTVLLTLGSFAQPPHDGKRGDHLAKMLDLTDDQRASVTAIMDSHRDRKRGLREMDREQRHEAMQLIKQDIRSDLSGVLTPEQLAKFDEIQAQRSERLQNRKLNRGKRGDHLAKMLELTDEQRVSVSAIMESHRDRKRGLREMDREQRHEAMQLIKQDIRSDLSGVLTPEQLAKFDEIQAQRSERLQNRKLNRGKRGDHMAKMLELTDEQRVSVSAIMESHRDRKRGLRDMDREQRHEAMQLIKQDIRSELANVLTPEQLARYDELQAHRSNRARHHEKHREHNGQSQSESRSDTL